MTYLEEISQRYNADTHHAFVLHGGTRDLQLGENGSCSLVDHVMGILGAASTGDQARLVVSYRVGIGWRFAQDSDRSEFSQIVGLDGRGNTGSLASLGVQQSDGDLPLDAASAIGLVDLAMRQTERLIVIVLDRAEMIAPATGYDRMSASDRATLSLLQAMASDRAVESTRNMLILITDALVDLHESLRLASSRYYAIEIVPPDYDERLLIAEQVYPQLASFGVSLELTTQEFAQATSMMTRYGLMDVLLDARSTGKLSKAQVRTVKAQVMSQEYGDVLEVLDPVSGGYKALAGMDALKTLFSQIVDNMIAGNVADVPAGLLLAGAAGLGKSYMMRCVAGESGLPVINLNIGRVLGSYVGQSERNLERVLTAIRSAAPCLVVIDEIETTFPDRANAGPSGDSGVSNRILKRMLEELSNPANRGRIVWIGITNYPQKLDAALSRAGRFDLTVAFLPPTEPERIALLRLYAGKYAVAMPDDDCLESVARQSSGYTNAEIENVVRKARQLLSIAPRTSWAWEQAILRVRANTRDVQSMTDNALLAVNDSDLLPDDYVERWRRLTGQTSQVETAKSVATKKLF